MGDFILTDENYYSLEADKTYMSVHQFLDFCSYLGIRGCEARAVAKLDGEYEEETTEAMLVGSYVDSYFEGTLGRFKELHPEIFTKQGELKAQYKRAEKMIARCEQDELFMKFMSGEKQTIMTGYLFGCDWKIKMDSYIPGVAITDLKTTSGDIHKAWNVADYGYVSFPEYWGYCVQLAIYREIVYVNTGKKLPCYIAAVTKEEEPDIAIIGIDEMTLEHSLNYVEMQMQSVLSVKNKEVEPIRCERCNYCKKTKKLTGAISLQDLIEV